MKVIENSIETCKNCKFRRAMPGSAAQAQPAQAFLCYYNPPSITTFIVGQEPTGRFRMHHHIQRPVVQPDDFCGHWRPLIEKAN